MTEELQSQLNETHYLENKKKEHERTFCILKNKYSRMETIRLERRTDLSTIKRNMRSIEEEIKK